MGRKRFSWGVEKQRNKNNRKKRIIHSIKRNCKKEISAKWWQNAVAVKPIY